MRLSQASWMVGTLVLGALMLAPRAAAAATCGSAPGDEAAIAAFVADARAACPCDGFARRSEFRRCVRERIPAAVAGGTLPAPCRARVMRLANRTTCGSVAGAVTCCAPQSRGAGTCTIARSAAACEAWRGGTGMVGASDWCHDACAPPSTPTPTPTLTPTPVLTALGPRCVCSCGPPPTPTLGGAYGCPSYHLCVVTTFVPADWDDCDVFDDGDNRGCTYHPDAPVPGSLNGPIVDACNF